MWDALEHCCLTEINEEGRKAVIRMRQYLMQLTLHPQKSNQIKTDRTIVDDINDRRAKLTSPRKL